MALGPSALHKLASLGHQSNINLKDKKIKTPTVVIYQSHCICHDVHVYTPALLQPFWAMSAFWRTKSVALDILLYNKGQWAGPLQESACSLLVWCSPMSNVRNGQRDKTQVPVMESICQRQYGNIFSGWWYLFSQPLLAVPSPTLLAFLYQQLRLSLSFKLNKYFVDHKTDVLVA